MKARKAFEVTVSVTELLALIRGQMPLLPELRFKLPESDDHLRVIPLHGPLPQAGHQGVFTAIRISWEEEA